MRFITFASASSVILLIIAGFYNYFSLDCYCKTTVLPSYTHIIGNGYISTQCVYLILFCTIYTLLALVGGGTTGCVLASRLSENKNNSVLLVEAGSFFNIFSTIPLFATLFQHTKYDWAYKTEPQLWTGKGLNDKVSFWPRGKGIGGSGQLNFMLHGMLDEHELNNWEKMGLNGIKNIRKYYTFLKNKNYCRSKDYLYETFLHKKCVIKEESKKEKNGLFQRDLNYNKLSEALYTAVNELNIPGLNFIPSISAIKNGRRWSSFNSHLLNVLSRPNLHILCNTEVKKIIFNKKQRKAIGIFAISRYKKNYKIYSTSEVIIAAGTINSPVLLLSSGIGNETELFESGITPVQDLPGVGKNLHDHLNMPIFVSLEEPVSVTLSKIFHPYEIWKYITVQKGLIAKSPIAGFAYSSQNISIILFGMGSTDEKLLKDISNYKTEIFRSLFPFYNNSSREGFSFLVTCPQPKSRGFIKLSNTSKIIIDPQYLSNTEDINCMTNGMDLIDKIINTTSFKKYGAKVHWPNITNCKKNKNYFKCLIQHAAITGYHPGGTCKMGNSKDTYTVVNSNFQVKGIKNLHIVDASVLPTPLSTFPNSILISMAEYASDLILHI